MKFFFTRNKDAGKPPAPEPPPTADIDALITQGNRLEDSGRFEEALDVYERAVRLAPDNFQTHLNLGNAMLLLGRADQATDHYWRSISLKPDHAGTHLNLGNALIAEGAFADAADSYRQAAQLHPLWSEAWFGLGCALERVQPFPFDAVVEAYRETLRLEPAHGAAASNLAAVLRENGQTQAARTLLEEVLSRAPENIPALLAQASMDRELGDPEAAVAVLRRLLALSPENPSANDGYLFALNLIPNIGSDAILTEHSRYGEWLVRNVQPSAPRVARGADRRLKIGYVSPDFRRHPVSCFVEPLLRHHDRSAFEIYCYYNYAVSDEITHRFVDLSDQWRDIANMPDDAVARGIAADGIDILVDLAGHTAGNRFGVFARKPAPIQCTWLGYLCTTGLTTIDYRLCDAHTDPAPQAEAWQVEKPLRLPNSQWCYQPQVALPPPSPLPRLTKSYWTFGSLNQASKLNAASLQLWGKLLAAIPFSRLRFIGITDPLLVERIRASLANDGVTADRIDVLGRVPIESYFSCYRDIDIALDTFPYNGATTTCDAFLMGVPVATVAGNRAIARGGVSLLSTMGLQKWIAPSVDEFVSMLLEHTRDPARLAALRAELPARMHASPLMDGPTFTRNLEALYRNIWRQACSAAD
jgi:predicted O-linked N-acetylglucosamine transferase (SPINDLY family)